MLVKLALFLLALTIVFLTLSSAFSCLERNQKPFQNMGRGFIALSEMTLSMYSSAICAPGHKELVPLAGCHLSVESVLAPRCYV